MVFYDWSSSEKDWRNYNLDEMQLHIALAPKFFFGGNAMPLFCIFSNPFLEEVLFGCNDRGPIARVLFPNFSFQNVGQTLEMGSIEGFTNTTSHPLETVKKTKENVER